MSGVFKSIGKIFKSVVNFVIKIAPYALAVAAVVFTGGAALGLLPTFAAAVGGVVSSLGLSAAVTGALTGAITSAGFGAALGFITGGKKGLQKGALMGALSGGILGAVSPGVFGIVKAADGAVTTAHAIASQAASAAQEMPVSVSGAGIPTSLSTPSLQSVADTLPQMDPALSPIQQTAAALGQNAADASGVSVQAAGQGIAPLAQEMQVSVPGAGIPSSLPTPALSADPSTFLTTPSTAVSSATANSGHSILSSLLGGNGGVGGNLTGLVGSVLQSLGPSQASQEANAEVKAREKLGQWAYGGVYSGNPNAFGNPVNFGAVPAPRYFYDKATNTVVDRQQPAAPAPPQGA